MVDVIVLGAGAAGLSCAHELVSSGIGCLVLEARHRVGGRIASVYDDRFPVPVELGAEFVHGFPPQSSAWIRRLELATYEVPDRHVWARRGKFRDMPEFWESLDRALSGRSRLSGLFGLPARDRSFAAALQRKWMSPRKKRLARAFVEGFHAADPARLSQNALDAETRAAAGTEGSRALKLLPGYSALVGGMLERTERADPGLPEGRPLFELRLGFLAQKVSWDRGRVEVEGIDRQGRTQRVEARSLVSTLPVGPLRSLEFSPRLERKEAAARPILSGSVMKLTLVFDDAFWTRTSLGHDLSFLHTPQRYFPTWWSSSPFLWPVLTAWTGGPAADDLVGLTKNELVRVACESLGWALAMSPSSICSRVRDARYHDWRSDAYSQGAYSYLEKGGADAPARLAEPVEGTLHFAGEATESAGIAGTVEAALRSGARAAREIIEAGVARGPSLREATRPGRAREAS